MNCHRFIRRIVLIAVLSAGAVVIPATVEAQLNGQNIKGDTGLKAGSQAAPVAYVAVPLYWYTADAVKDRTSDTSGSLAPGRPTEGAAWNVMATFLMKPIKAQP